MALDFTLAAYRELLSTFRQCGFSFYTYQDYINGGASDKPHVLLRHDVDRFPSRALALAKVEYNDGVHSTFFFRTKEISFNKAVILAIAGMGHDIGYHYEELCDAKGDVEAAWEQFSANLTKFAGLAEIKSIARHGRPFSKWDSLDLWNSHDYRSLGIAVDVDRDVNWAEYAYFTDVGRSWNSALNRRDRAKGGLDLTYANSICRTRDLMSLIKSCRVNYVISTHPERWSGTLLAWCQVLMTDTAINLLKRLA